ncbi:MAG: lysine--tRNA ligase, partial [Rhodothermaceae bacterium]|nr:lysine--tRNA ligase [Rhodothermaceae bacterium]
MKSSSSSSGRQLTDQEQIRRKSREALEALGVNPYPYAWPVTDHVVPVLEEFDEAASQETVSMAGRLMSRRIMGKASFFDFQDATGRMQAYV